MSLTDTRIRTAKATEKVYKLYDSAGLYLEVPPKGNKRWCFKYILCGKEKRISLGVYPEISLKIARERRDRARHLVATGIDPVVAFRSGFPKSETGEASETFHAVAEEWFAKFEKGWKTSHSRTIKSRLEKYAYPELGKKNIVDVLPTDVLRILRLIEANNALETAKRTLSICSQICRYAVATARIPSDPCRDLKGALAPVISKLR